MKTTGPDSCKSWCVAIGCSCILLLVTIPARLSGLIYVACIEHYDSQRTTAALPFILFNVLKSFLGPIVGYLGEVFGLRSITAVGCLLAALGVTACSFAKDMSIVIVSIGIIHGAGFALSSSLTPSILKQHFQKNVSNSNGISYVGICISAFVFPPIFKFLWEIFGVSGAFLILSGIMLNAVPIAMLLKNPKYTTEISHSSKKETKPSRSVLNEPAMELETCKIAIPSNNSGLSFIGNDVSKILNSASENSLNKADEISDKVHVLPSILQGSIEEKPTSEKISEDNEQDQHKSVIIPPRKERKYKMAWKSLRILWNPHFLIIMTTQSLLSFIMFFIWTIIVDLSRDKCISGHLEIYFLMFLPVSEVVGYLSLGWVTDKKFLTKSNFCGLGYLGVALSCSVMTWSAGFTTLMAGVCIFGIFSSALLTVYPGLVFQFVDKEDQTMALTSRMILHAPLSFAAAPLIGYFRGDAGSYDGLLYLLTGISAFCSVLIVLLPTVDKCRRFDRKRMFLTH